MGVFVQLHLLPRLGVEQGDFSGLVAGDDEVVCVGEGTDDGL